jgi:hypothetical protein
MAGLTVDRIAAYEHVQLNGNCTSPNLNRYLDS